MLVPPNIQNQRIVLPLLKDKQVSLSIKRLDLIHPLVSGNKYFKLKYNLLEAKNSGFSQVLTFGGAFSNHIYATAAAAQQHGMKAIGVIRGEETLPLNPTLSFAKDKGMQIIYLDRINYRTKNSQESLDELKKLIGPYFLIPEGGTNALAIKGTAEILQKEDGLFDHVAVSIGTGGTFAGLASTISKNQNLLGFSSLKGNFIHQEISGLLHRHEINSMGKFEILDQYHFGGYAKFTTQLVDFMTDFFKETAIPLDPIYTGKMIFGLLDMIKNNKFEKGTKILAIHTGGLQGNLGFNERHNLNLPH